MIIQNASLYPIIHLPNRSYICIKNFIYRLFFWKIKSVSVLWNCYIYKKNTFLFIKNVSFFFYMCIILIALYMLLHVYYFNSSIYVIIYIILTVLYMLSHVYYFNSSIYVIIYIILTVLYMFQLYLL